MSVEQNAFKNRSFFYPKMHGNTHFQDYWLTDPRFKFWVRKSDVKTAFCSCC